MRDRDAGEPGDARERRARALRVAAAVAGALVIVVGVGMLVGACLTSRATAGAFVAAVHEDRVADARALAAPEMIARLGEGVRADEDLATLARVHAAARVEIDGMVQLGFSDPFVWFACIDATLDERTKLWIVLRRIDGTWRVEHVASAEPENCHGSD